MKIVTCLKEVPARDSRYQITDEGTGIKESDLTFEINECDEYSSKRLSNWAKLTVGKSPF